MLYSSTYTRACPGSLYRATGFIHPHPLELDALGNALLRDPLMQTVRPVLCICCDLSVEAKGWALCLFNRGTNGATTPALGWIRTSGLATLEGG